MRLILYALVVMAVVSCSKPQSFDYRDIRNFKVEKLGFDRSTIGFELVYYNPNNFGVQLRKVDCDVYINNNFLGKYLLDTVMNIPRKAEFSLPSKMDVDMKNVFKNSFAAIFSNEVLLTVKGTTRVGKGGIFLNVPVNYEGRHKVDIF